MEPYAEMLRSTLSRPRDRYAGRDHDRDVARLLAPWRGHREQRRR